MPRSIRKAAFVSLLVLVAAACGSRVVPLETGALGQGGQPIVNPTATGTGVATTNPSINPTTGQPITPTSGGPGAVANCAATKTTDVGATKDTLKIGLVAAIGGSFRGQFDANIQAVDAYFKMINAEQNGICGRKVELIIRDDGGNAARNSSAAEELANEVGVFAFVGSVSAPDSDTGVARVSREKKIPDIGFPLTYQRSESPYTFGVPGQLQKRLIGEGANGSRWLNETNGIKQIAMLWVGESQVSGANAWAFEAAMLKTSGGSVKICYERETSVTDLNFDSYANAIKGSCPSSGGPLAIYSTMENNSNIRLAAALRNQSVTYKVLALTFTSYLQSYVRDGQGNPRAAAEGTYIAMPQVPFERCQFDANRRPVSPCSHAELDRYIRALQRYRPGSVAPGSWGAPGWGQADLFTRAARACGANLTRACVIDQIKAIRTFSANGLLSPTTPKERVIYTTDLITQVKNGRFVELRPNDTSGPSEAPHFWDESVLMDWWNYFCANKAKFSDQWRGRIDEFVTSC